MCLAVTCHLHCIVAERPGSLTCYCGNTLQHISALFTTSLTQTFGTRLKWQHPRSVVFQTSVVNTHHQKLSAKNSISGLYFIPTDCARDASSFQFPFKTTTTTATAAAAKTTTTRDKGSEARPRRGGNCSPPLTQSTRAGVVGMSDTKDQNKSLPRRTALA